MKKNDNILLISDLDDTLLTTEKTIADVDLSAINAFVEAGGSFTVATGRVYESSLPYIQQLPITHPCVLYNGGMIYDTKNSEVLWKCCLSDKAKDYMVEVLDAFPTVAAEILIGKDIYVPRFNDILSEKMVMENVTYIFCKMNEIPDNWIKVLFSVTQEDMPDVIAYIDGKNYEDVCFVQSCGIYYEMLPKDVSKGAAIDRMLEITGNNGMKLAAIGDYNNDIEMIKRADFGACVSNSPEDVKAIADIVIAKTSDEGAVAAFINFIMNLEEQ